MFEFFLALFGGAYWGSRILNTYSKDKKDSIATKNKLDRIDALNKKYCAPSYITSFIEKQIKENREDLEKEFHDDLVFIFGKNFETDKNNPNVYSDWYYSLQDSLKHLILARDYKMMEDFIGGYSSGYKREHAKYCIRLFKKINEYINDEEVELTLRPGLWGGQESWSVYCATFVPAIYNPWLNDMNAKMWMSMLK